MRLLDRIACHRAPLLLTLDHRAAVPFEVTGPRQFASRVAECPLRFVLGDDLTRACADLAFADGARLAGCLDLLRMPARHMWIEWNDEVHQRVIYETRSAAGYDAASSGRRVGVLLHGSPDGYGAMARTFWAGAAETSEVTMSPLETHIDLHGDYDHGPERDPGSERRISVGLEGRAGDPADPNDLATQRSPEACA